MYVPKRYELTDAAIIDQLIRENPFATLVSDVAGVPAATHLPLQLVSAGGRRLLQGHFARANNHWKSITPQTEVLAIFTGPHTYISPRWYGHVNVPTWNYIAIHCYGKLRFLGPDELRAALRDLVNFHEGRGSEYSVDTLPQDFLNAQMSAIVGFEIAVARVEAAVKLSQNRNAQDFQNVIAELRARGDASSLAVAAAMEKLAKPAQ
jgi:transcriptional regulator